MEFLDSFMIQHIITFLDDRSKRKFSYVCKNFRDIFLDDNFNYAFYICQENFLYDESVFLMLKEKVFPDWDSSNVVDVLVGTIDKYGKRYGDCYNTKCFDIIKRIKFGLSQKCVVVHERPIFEYGMHKYVARHPYEVRTAVKEAILNCDNELFDEVKNLESRKWFANVVGFIDSINKDTKLTDAQFSFLLSILEKYNIGLRNANVVNLINCLSEKSSYDLLLFTENTFYSLDISRGIIPSKLLNARKYAKDQGFVGVPFAKLNFYKFLPPYDEKDIIELLNFEIFQRSEKRDNAKIVGLLKTIAKVSRRWFEQIAYKYYAYINCRILSYYSKFVDSNEDFLHSYKIKRIVLCEIRKKISQDKSIERFYTHVLKREKWIPIIIEILLEFDIVGKKVDEFFDKYIHKISHDLRIKYAYKPTISNDILVDIITSTQKFDLIKLLKLPLLIDDFNAIARSMIHLEDWQALQDLENLDKHFEDCEKK